MQAATPYIAIVVSVVSLVISLGVAVANYTKSKSDTFNQRRDHLAQAISELNARNSETQLISARYTIVEVKMAGLGLRLSETQAEKNAAMIASIKKLREGMEEGRKGWDGNIKDLHLLYKNLTSETDADQVERYIASVRVASDDLKKFNETFYHSLHVLETTNQLNEKDQAEIDEKLKQILDIQHRQKHLGK
jgi:hypothetical protein